MTTLEKKVSNLVKNLECEITTCTLKDLVQSSHTFYAGDGQWGISLNTGYDEYSHCIAEFVGSNGQLYDEDPDDLWGEVDKWMSDPQGGLAIHHKTYTYTLPDGCRLSFKKLIREVEQGHLHGLVLSF